METALLRREGDTRLITERRKIIDAGEAHHLPPRMFVMPALGLVRPLDLSDLIEQPPCETASLMIFHLLKTKRPPDEIACGYSLPLVHLFRYLHVAVLTETRINSTPIRV
jgi:hypothetical protein